MSGLLDNLRSAIDALIVERDAEVARHKSAMAPLEEKISALSRAVLVLAKDSADFEAKAPPVVTTEASTRPDGLPTVPDMIIAILADAPGGQMEPKDILTEVQRRYWDGFKSSDVGPTAWRMWKAERLVKSGNLYGLPNVIEAPTGESQ